MLKLFFTKLLLITNVGICCWMTGVPGTLLVGVGVGVEADELMLSIDPRLFIGRRLRVPLLLLSSLLLRL